MRGLPGVTQYTLCPSTAFLLCGFPRGVLRKQTAYLCSRPFPFMPSPPRLPLHSESRRALLLATLLTAQLHLPGDSWFINSSQKAEVVPLRPEPALA